MARINLVNIDKVYDNGFEAVHKFNLEIKDNEFIIFVGPSGCGKSTTLRMIAGLEEISRGELYIDDKLVNNLSPNERGIAMVFQSYALYPTMTVYDNLAFGLRLKGFDEDEIEERVDEVSKILGIEAYLQRKPKNLSGGQRQRVALGRSLIRHTKVFLMDEPLSNLDAIQRVNMRSEIIKIHRRVGATTIYVTHDQVEAMTMADRIVVMKDGYIQQVGTPKELYFKPYNLFVAGFIGDPPMNFFNGKVDGENFVTEDGFVFSLKGYDKDHLQRIAEHESVVMGFRPEDCSVDPLKVPSIKEDMIVEINEMLGDTLNIYGDIGCHKMVVRTNPFTKFELDKAFHFEIAYDNLHFFDKKSTDRIY